MSAGRSYKTARSRLFSARDGTAAVEFAIIAPLFLMTIFTMLGYGIYLGASHSIQQMTADAARTAVAGLSETERKTLASAYIRSASAKGYAFIDADKLAIDVGDDATQANQFTVTIKYDSRNLPIWNLFTFAMPDEEIRRFTTIRVGGA